MGGLAHAILMILKQLEHRIGFAAAASLAEKATGKVVR
jgi:hypothetical protein